MILPMVIILYGQFKPVKLGLTTEVSGPVADWGGLERHRGWQLEDWGVERQELSGGHRAWILIHYPIPPRILDQNAPGTNTSRAPSAPTC